MGGEQWSERLKPIAADPSADQRARAEEIGIRTEAENNIAIRGADIIVVAVKPQIAGQVLKSLDTVSKSQLVISIAAGISLDSLQSAPQRPTYCSMHAEYTRSSRHRHDRLVRE